MTTVRKLTAGGQPILLAVFGVSLYLANQRLAGPPHTALTKWAPAGLALF